MLTRAAPKMKMSGSEEKSGQEHIQHFLNKTCNQEVYGSHVVVVQSNAGCKESHITACHSGKLKLTFTSPNIISTSPKNVLMSRLISQSSLIWIPQKTSLARQTSYNRIHQPDSKTHQSRAIGLYLLCTKCTKKKCAEVLFFFSNKKKKCSALAKFFLANQTF